MCLLGVHQRFGSGMIVEGGTCARGNIYRPSLRSAEADISSTLDTLATINKLDTIISIHLKPFYRYSQHTNCQPL